MKVWVVMAKVEEIQARSVDKVFDSKGKTHKYNRTKRASNSLAFAGIDHSVRRRGSWVNDLLNKDLIENDPEKVAKAVIELEEGIIKRIHTFDSLISDPWISVGGKERAKRNKERGFVQTIKELVEFPIDYTCNDKNRELENQSKKIVTRAREFSLRLQEEPMDQVIEAWLREQD